MKTITFNRYSYSFYRNEQGQPIVDHHIEGKFVQRMRITAEGGNELYTNLRKYKADIERSCIRMDKWVDRGADNIFCKAFIAFDRLNSITFPV